MYTRLNMKCELLIENFAQFDNLFTFMVVDGKFIFDCMQLFAMKKHIACTGNISKDEQMSL